MRKVKFILVGAYEEDGLSEGYTDDNETVYVDRETALRLLRDMQEVGSLLSAGYDSATDAVMWFTHNWITEQTEGHIAYPREQGLYHLTDIAIEIIA